MSENKIFAKIEDGVVTDIACAGSIDWIEENPERYGDSSLWRDAYFEKEGKRYAGIGFTYDVEKDNYYPPLPSGDKTFT